MKIPFTTEEFFNVFEKYNAGVFPAQIIIILMGITGMVFLHSENKFRDRYIGLFLGILWLWSGIIYFITYFTAINKPAYLFGGLFITQAILLLLNAFSPNRMRFSFTADLKGYFGYFFAVFGLLIYPVIEYFIGGSLMRTITLGLPCPTVILTFGYFLLTTGRFRIYLLVIPVLWSLMGLSAAINFGVYPDFMLIVAAIISGFALIRKNRPTKETIIS